ncbi:hypothetical protein QFZ52_002232 [Arthrobacter woluwensis]|uniref:hypothetical protein n=1 Tax=Arthrobacter woluwensis TaxID=156980 RepID=UPI00278AF300|nr:hypothetical protein [Arthrobacter woluwensis]MDQ0709580.1 hypothetical protein [Arthrobacter woluwensis]
MPWWTSGPDRDAGKHRVVEMRDSAEIFAPVELIWGLLRPAEYAPLLVPGAVRGYADPPAEGVGEVRHLVAKRAGKEFHAAVEILEEVPFRKIVARSWGQSGPEERFELRLEPTEKGALVERICTHHPRKWSLVPASACRKQHAQWHRREFVRIQELLDGGWTPGAST